MSFARGFIKGFIGQSLDKKAAADAALADLNSAVAERFLTEIQPNFIKNEQNIEKRFNLIYKTNFWSSNESVSGYGSELKNTINIEKEIINIIKKYQIKSILDAPCGDFNWVKNVLDKDLTYIGGDIVQEIIDKNIKKFKNDKLDFINVIWIVGKNNYESLKHLKRKNIIIYDYCNEMSSLYQNVDLVLSRSGAMTIAELIKFEKPSILVPFKFSSENHQHFNAKFLQDNFCSKLIKEDDFNDETFISTLRNLSQDDRILGSMKSNFKNINVPDTLSIISNFIMEKKYAL